MSCHVLPRGLGYSCHPVLVISGNTKLDMHPATGIMFSQGYVKHILHFSCEIFGLELFRSPGRPGKNSVTSYVKRSSCYNVWSMQIVRIPVIEK